MKQYGRSGKEIAQALCAAESLAGRNHGMKAISRRLGVSRSTLGRWRRQYRGLTPTQVDRLVEVTRRVGELERRLAEAMVDAQVLRLVAAGK